MLTYAALFLKHWQKSLFNLGPQDVFSYFLIITYGSVNVLGIIEKSMFLNYILCYYESTLI